MIGSCALFSGMSVLIRIASAFDPSKITFYRFVIGIAILVTLALFRRIKLEFNNIPLLIVRGITGGIAVFCFFLAISKIGLAKGTIVSNTYPIFATIGAALFLKEKVRWKTWLFVLLCIVGMILTNYDGARGEFALDTWTLIALGGSFFSGIAIVSVRRLARTDNPSSIIMSQCIFGLWMVILPANIETVELSVAAGILLIAIGLTATIAQLMMTWSYRHVDVSTGSLLSMLMTVFNVIIGMIFFGESRGPVSVIGMAIVIIACAGVVFVNQRRELIVRSTA
jgi:drug/metabolite transporter (DMT)-like permease